MLGIRTPRIKRMEKHVGRAYKRSFDLFLDGLHVACIGAFFYAITYGFSAANWILAGLLLFLTGLGITIGNHRWETHESFKTHEWIGRVFLLLSAAAATLQKTWGYNHRMHHLYSDQPQKEPHSPLMFKNSWDAFWWPQWNWLKFEYVPPADAPSFQVRKHQAALDWQERWFVPIVILSVFIVPFLIVGLESVLRPELGVSFWQAGLEGVLLSGITRLTVGIHQMGLINSAGHMFGKKMLSDSNSRNNGFTGLLTGQIGEGWHGNHHAHAKSARLGWHWWQIDIGWYIISILGRLGYVWDITLPKNQRSIQSAA